MLIDPLGLDTAIAGFNGGLMVRPDLTVIESRALAPAVAREALDAILAQGLDAWVYTIDEWLVRDREAPHVAREAWTVKFDARVVPEFTDDDLATTIKIVGVSDDHDLVARAEEMLRHTLGERAAAARSQPYYLDVTHPDANKGAVVAEPLQDDRPRTRADRHRRRHAQRRPRCFERSGFSIAMGNASAEVKARASAVTDTNEDDGFAKAMERFILPASVEATRK